MTDTKEPLAAWRSEISAELTAAREQHAQAQREAEAAATAADLAARVYGDLQRALAPIIAESSTLTRSRRSSALIVRQAALAPAIVVRLEELKRAHDSASGRRVRAQGEVVNALKEVRDRELALEQLDLVLAPQATEEAA